MENNSQAIELKGIARSLTKLGVQDGQCEDIVNLRLKDGSWRVSDDGKLVHTLPDNYTQLYVHTNVYHHLLGVLNGKLWYFADIDNDSETFTPLDTPVEICEVQGEVTIVQNGHLLTIKYDSKLSYAIFNENANMYKMIILPTDDHSSARELSPFGQIHLNFSTEKEVFKYENKDAGKLSDNGLLVPKEDEEDTFQAAQLWHASMLKVYNEAQDKNYFTRPFLAIIAVKLYDGSYLYASNPIYMNPREASTLKKAYINHLGEQEDILNPNNVAFQLMGVSHDINSTEYQSTINYTKGVVLYTRTQGDITPNASNSEPVYLNGALDFKYYIKNTSGQDLAYDEEDTYMTSQVIGSKLLLSLGDLSTLIENKDVFTGISVFITPEVSIYDMSSEGYKKGGFVTYRKEKYLASNKDGYIESFNLKALAWNPNLKDDKDIIYDLINSPFYLLKTYRTEDLIGKRNSTIEVDLYNDREDEKLLANILQQDSLDSLALNRDIVYGECMYNYNSKLHLANITDKLFSGYPIDYFYLNNLMLTPKAPYEDDGGNIIKSYYRRVIPDVENVDSLEQFKKNRYNYCWEDNGFIKDAILKGVNLASISVYIGEGDESIVVSKIIPYEGVVENNDGGLPNFVNDLNPLLCYPNASATKMEVKIITYDYLDDIITVYFKDFKLNPHKYLNLAYYINDNLKPIDISKWNKETQIYPDWIPTKNFKTVEVKNNSKLSTNKIRVSAVANPFYFPYANTYQVGSSEIVALMSNAVALGTGQTGVAPLYVFCKDGIYALLVDSSGELVYTNARIIARDVCNNANSVTPIDSGVVFTTDRGLMSIAGSEVIELGQIAEGDVFDITDTSDKAKKIMFNSFTMSQLGALPQDLLDNVDFLTFLKGSIVNYNHNERELMVSNPNYKYTYVMDRNGNWSRRNYRADEYVNNYPTSYRVQHVSDQYGERSYLYKVDTESTSLGNQIYLLSQVIKLGTIAFKQAYRLVVRGYFESIYASTIGCYVFGSYDGRQWALLGRNEKSGKFTDIGCKIAHTDVKFLRLCLAGQLSKESRIDFVEVAADGSILNTKVR